MIYCGVFFLYIIINIHLTALVTGCCCRGACCHLEGLVLSQRHHHHRRRHCQVCIVFQRQLTWAECIIIRYSVMYKQIHHAMPYHTIPYHTKLYYSLQLSAKSVGVFEAFYNSIKPVTVGIVWCLIWSMCLIIAFTVDLCAYCACYASLTHLLP